MPVQEEILLTKEEIAFISNKAKYSLMMHNPAIIGQFTKNWWDIMHISPVKKLLFIQGHQFTGLAHINKRHRHYTNEHSPVKEGFVITSKFSSDSGTLMDYSKLAEYLFDERHKVTGKNKRPKLFDVYQAKIEYKKRSEYCLIVYKDSTIVHTLFPIVKNKPIREYKKEDYFIEYQEPHFIRGFIPYTDTHGNLKFGIGVRMIMTENRESWVGLIYGEEGKLVAKIEFGEMNIQYKWGFEKRIESLNYADLTKHENVILDFIKKEKL